MNPEYSRQPLLSVEDFQAKVFRAMRDTGARRADAERVVLEFYRAKAQSTLATESDVEAQFKGSIIPMDDE